MLNMLTAVVLAAGFSWLLFHDFQTDKRGVVINHLIELSPGQAAIVDLVGAVMFGLFAIIGLLAILRNLRGPKHLTLTETQLIVPNSGFLGKLNVLNVSDIQGVQLISIRRLFSQTRYLYVYHTGGKIWINEDYFVYETEFDELHQALTHLVQHHEMPQQV
jgi:hypothetical protein